MRDLQLTPKIPRSKSAKGRETQQLIIETALRIFIDHGYGEFSIQKVAHSCGLSRGNVSYYYPTKNALLHSLLQAVVQGYVDEFDEVAADETLSPEEKFLSIIDMIMKDLGTRETSHFFPELWALSNRSKIAMTEMNTLYKKAREHLVELLRPINPRLNARERELVGLFISASMEGHTPFVGSGKEWEDELPAITNIASFSFLSLARSITPNEIKKFEPRIRKRLQAAE